MTAAARVAQWQTTYSTTSSVAAPQGPGSDLFPELHLSLLTSSFFPLSWLSLSFLLTFTTTTTPPPPFSCSDKLFLIYHFRVYLEATKYTALSCLSWHCFCLFFVYCDLSLGVKGIVKGRVIPSETPAPISTFWSLLVHRGNSLGRTMIGYNNEDGGLTQKTRPLHHGKGWQRKQMLWQRTHRRGWRDRKMADVSVSPSQESDCIQLFRSRWDVALPDVCRLMPLYSITPSSLNLLFLFSLTWNVLKKHLNMWSDTTQQKTKICTIT